MPPPAAPWSTLVRCARHSPEPADKISFAQPQNHEDVMRVLFSTVSPASHQLPPQFGDDQVNCGPDWTDGRDASGRVRSLATPVGDYDLAAVAARLPSDQQPDVVVCLVDASWRNTPSNLAAFKCPRVLLIGGTHGGQSPLLTTMRYATSEPFDRTVFVHDRHHAMFFHAAGLRNLFWFPGLTFPHGDAAVRAARLCQRDPQLAFVGRSGGAHPRRTRLLETLAATRLPLVQRVLPQRQALDFYGASLLGFNASLNGDLNLRVFEILASGAALITDRLAPESGLEDLFTDGKELATYADDVELALLTTEYLQRPDEARAMGEAGAEWFDTHLGETRRREAFRRLACDGIGPAEFAFKEREKARVFFGGDTDRLLESVQVYEGVQELHRTRETVRVAVDKIAPDDLIAIYSTLPRVDLSRPDDGNHADLAIFTRDRAAAVPPGKADHLWCCDAGEADFDPLATRFESAGFRAVAGKAAVFIRAAEPPLPEPETTLVEVTASSAA